MAEIATTPVDPARVPSARKPMPVSAIAFYEAVTKSEKDRELLQKLAKL